MVTESKSVTIELSKEKHPEFGMMGKLTFDNKSSIYIFKDGWHLKHPDDEKGMTVPWSEINIAVENSIKLGYVHKESKKKKG